MTIRQGLLVFLAAFTIPPLVFACWWVKARLDERWSEVAWGRDE